MLIVLLLELFWSASGRAQQEGKTAQLLNMYRECVIDAIGSQLRNSSGEAIRPLQLKSRFKRAGLKNKQSLRMRLQAG
jgi:hypothetical protein